MDQKDNLWQVNYRNCWNTDNFIFDLKSSRWNDVSNYCQNEKYDDEFVSTVRK